MAVTEFTAAISGSGKSYRRCAHFLATEFLPLHTGRIWSNYPIHIQEMVSDVVEHYPDLVASELKARIKIIPEDVLLQWRKGKSGPWDYFHDEHLEGDRIAIDEIHNYCNKSSGKEIIEKWMEFLGELRHRGCEFEGLSQYDTKVHKAIRDEAGLKRDLFNSESTRDPFFQILMSDWYNLRAKFWTGEYTSTVYETEYVPVQGKWKKNHVVKFAFQERFYKLYDSYSAPVAGGKKASGPSQPWKEKTKGQLAIWFLIRNWFAFVWRFMVVTLAIWLCFFGGAMLAINGFMGLQKDIMESNTKAIKPQQEQNKKVVVSEEQMNQVKPGVVAVHDDLLKTIALLRIENSALQADIEKYKNQLDKQSDITLLGKTYAVTRGGIHLVLHESVPIGQHAGKLVKEFDFARRCVVLDDGTRLHVVK